MHHPQSSEQHPKDLYQIEVRGSWSAEQSLGELPTIVSSVMGDYEDEFSEIVRENGIACHPQIVAASAVRLEEPYFHLTAKEDPQLAASLIYGTVLLGERPEFHSVADILNLTFMSPLQLPDKTLHLIEKSFLNACAHRQESTDNLKNAARLNPRIWAEIAETYVKRAIKHANYQRPKSFDTSYPAFEHARDLFNQILQAVIEKRPVDQSVFGSLSKTPENYLLAVLGSRIADDCPVRAQARAYLKRLDPILNSYLNGKEEAS